MFIGKTGGVVGVTSRCITFVHKCRYTDQAVQLQGWYSYVYSLMQCAWWTDQPQVLSCIYHMIFTRYLTQTEDKYTYNETSVLSLTTVDRRPYHTHAWHGSITHGKRRPHDARTRLNMCSTMLHQLL